MPVNLSRHEIAQRLEYAVLEPTTVRTQLDEACRAGRREGIGVVCVRPCDLRRCAEALNGSRTAAGTVVGFPHGGSTRTVKVHEALEAIEDAHSVLNSNGVPVELDLVVNSGSILSDDWGALRDEILAVRDVTHARGGVLKVVFEPALLDENRIRRLCETCRELAPGFVTLGTGFGPRKPTSDEVTLVRQMLPVEIGIKVTCNPDSREEFDRLVAAGASRIATSRAVDFLTDLTD